jgi:hypothetical protein
MARKTLTERLNEAIEEKEEKISSLQGQIEKFEQEKDWERQSWMQHTLYPHDAFSQRMPVPRLEMRLIRVSKNNWYRSEWQYGIVRKHYQDTWGDLLQFIPLGLTESTGGDGGYSGLLINGKFNLPFRDGMHIKADSVIFNLPAFATCKELDRIEVIDTSVVTQEKGYILDKMRYKP